MDSFDNAVIDGDLVRIVGHTRNAVSIHLSVLLPVLAAYALAYLVYIPRNGVR
jgi:hypothetical protein